MWMPMPDERGPIICETLELDRPGWQILAHFARWLEGISHRYDL